MKKIISLLLAVMIAAPLLAGCGEPEPAPEPVDTPAEEVYPTPLEYELDEEGYPILPDQPELDEEGYPLE